MALVRAEKDTDKQTTLDETVHVGVTSHGTILFAPDNPKQVTKDGLIYVGGDRAHHHLRDMSWSLARQLERKNFVEEFDWDTSLGQDVVLRSYDVPYDLLTTNLSNDPFQNYTYARFQNIKVHFQVQGTRFQCGQLIAYFEPTCKPVSQIDESLLNDTRRNRMLLQHILLDPSQSEPGEFLIPFVFNKGWINLKEFETLGLLKIAVFNQLTAAVGTSSTVKVRVLISLDGVEFKIPRPKNNIVIPPRVKKTRIISGVKQSALLGGISDLVDDMTEELLPFAQVVDMVANVLDKKQIAVQYPPIVNKDMGYLTHMKNDEYVDNLVFNPSTMQLTDQEHYATKVNEMSIDYLTKEKWNILNTVKYSTELAPKQILWSAPVGPFGFDFLVTTTPFELTTIDWFARRFRYWRGGFKLGFQFVTAAMHEGRVSVVFLPGVDASGLASLDYSGLQSQYMATFQLKGGQNCFAVDVPYLSQTPYNLVWSGESLNASTFSDYFLGTVVLVADTPLKVMQNLPTSVDVNVFLAANEDFELNTPTFYNNSITTITADQVVGEKESETVEKEKLKEEKKPKEEEKKETPSEVKKSEVKKDTPQVTQKAEKKVQMKTPNFSASPRNVAPVVLCADQHSLTSDPKAKHFGEHIFDLQQMMKRYVPIDNASYTLQGLIESQILTVEEANNIIAGVEPLILAVPASSLFSDVLSIVNQRHFIAETASMFRLARTPLVFKIKLTSTDNQQDHVFGYISYLNATATDINLARVQDLSKFFPSSIPIPDVIGASPMPMTYISTTHVSEFKIPFMHHQGTTVLRKVYDIVAGEDVNDYCNTFLLLAVYGLTSLTAAVTYTVHASFGDEATFGLFIGLNPVKLERRPTGGSTFPDSWIPDTPPPLL